ncbi:MAG: DUF2087 domain-containing protein [Proteobacteria bacterium]|nr:DUF2087 domain-containing protein [Pseudomonadota bacterium]
MIDKDAVVALLRRIFHGGQLRRLPKKREDADVLMALSLSGLDRDGIFDETQINVHLSAWLDDISTQDSLDYVTLRRDLVDSGFLRRASDGFVYRIQPDRIREVLSSEACAVDPKEIFAEVQSARDQRRRSFGQRS